MAMSHHHVIVGDGASAAAMAEAVCLGRGDRLTIIGPNAGRLGRGLAYADHAPKDPWRYSYLMNSPSEGFGDAFVEWFAKGWSDLRDQIGAFRPDWLEFNAQHIAEGDFGAVFAPRAIYGDWLAETAQDALARHHENGVDVSLRTGIAASLTPMGKSLRITLSGGEVIQADRVDVATGGPGTQRFGSDAGPTAFTTLYGNETTIAEVLAPGQTVTCLGGNAAMLDVLRFLQSIMDERDIRLRIISRGEEPEPLVLTRPRRDEIWPQITGPFEKVSDLVAAVDDEMKVFRAGGASMAELRPGYLDWAKKTPLAGLLPSHTERRLVLPLLERRFRRGTHDSINDYRRLRAAGQIEEVNGDITWVYAEAPGKVRIRIDTKNGQEELHVPFTINTTGPGNQLPLDLLTSGMVRDGLLDLNADKSGITVDAGLQTRIEGVRYLSPAITEIGGEPLAFALNDVLALQELASGANAPR
jgi:uncharacterized NAD(P)/FAD-binding protein YdhS